MLPSETNEISGWSFQNKEKGFVKMDIRMTIDAIEELVDSFKEQSKVERLQTYAAVKTLLGEIREFAKQEEEDGNVIPNLNIYLAELVTPLQCLGGIEDCSREISDYQIELTSGLRKLRSMHCFNL
ncbi:conserved hypothetical protein [delta proteobacterium NaphS2]|nr:conserved hypothetical protein [delta proteobacterium NaphS2]